MSNLIPLEPAPNNLSLKKLSKRISQFINSSIEPTLFYDWCKKAGKRQSSESKKLRLCVVTPAALYIFKSSFVSHFKLSQTFPLVAIKSLIVKENSNEVKLVFENGKIELIFEKIGEFVTKFLSLIKSMLPSYFAFEVSLPMSLEIKGTRTTAVQLADLFLSKCKENDEDVDPKLILNLRSDLRHNKPLTIDSSQFSDGKISALCFALTYSPDVSEVTFSGKSFYQLYSRVSKIVTKNSGILDVEIAKYKNTNDFEHFIQSLKKSKVKFLTFTECNFTTNMAEFLAKNLKETSVKYVSFNGSQFGKNCIETFSNYSPEIHGLSVRNDVFNSINYFQLVSVCLSETIRRIAINDSNFDIAQFFDAISSNASEIYLKTIDLSGNLCSSNFTGKYILPSTLNKIVLQRTKWEGNSLITLLTHQSYMNKVEIDLSNAFLNNIQLKDFIHLLPESPPESLIKVFIWCNNPIFVKLFSFISKYKYLEKLVLDNCSCPKNEKKTIISALASLVSRVNIKTLSIQNITSEYGNKLIGELMEPLHDHRALAQINVSDNQIGDNGLTMLGDIISRNSIIRSIAFDGCHVQNYKALVSFLVFCAQTPSLKHISKPHKEFTRLFEKFGKGSQEVKELKISWSKVSARLKHNRHRRHRKNRNVGVSESDMTTSTVTDTISTLTASNIVTSSIIINDQISNVGFTQLLAEWKVDFDLPNYEDIHKWEQLRQDFSYANITGIPALEMTEDQNSDDLIVI